MRSERGERGEGAAGQGHVEIAMADFEFVGDQQVPPGGQVVLANTDGASHTGTAVDGSFESRGLAEGDSYEFTFDERGTFECRCNIHPSMIETITVAG